MGKGGGGGPSVTEYVYKVSLAIGLGQGPIAGVRRIWVDNKLMIQQDPEAWVDFNKLQKQLNWCDSLTVYLGTETQQPDPVIEADKGVGNTPAYLGEAYIVIENMDITDYGRIPNIECEIASASSDIEVKKTGVINGRVLEWSPHFEMFLKNDGHGDYIRLKNWNFETLYNVDQYIDPADYPDSYMNIVGYMDSGRMCLWWDYFGTGVLTNAGSADGNIWLWDEWGVLQWHVKLSDVSPEGSFSELSFMTVGQYERDPVFSFLSDGYFHFYESTKVKLCGIGQFSSIPIIAKLPLGGFQVFVDDGITTNERIMDCAIYDGILYVLAKASSHYALYTIDPFLGTAEKVIDNLDNVCSDVGGNTPVNNITFYDTGDMIVQNYSNEVYVMDGISNTVKTMISYSDGSANPVDVADVVSDILDDAGLPASDYDVSDLSGDTVIGYVRPQVMTAEQALKPLMRLYKFDVIEADWKVVCKKRGGSSVVNIPWDDLAAHEYGKEQPEPMIENVIDETRMPLEIMLNYADYNADYQDAVEYASRATAGTNTTNKQSLDYPVVMQATQALQAVEALFETAWVQRKQYKIQVPIDYIKLLPGDVFTVAGAYTLLVDSVTVSFPNLLEIEASAEDSNSYVSNSVGTAPNVAPQEITFVPNVTPIFIETNAVRTWRDDPGFYIAAFAVESGYRLSVLYRSLDDGQTWNAVSMVENMTTVGLVSNTLGDGLTTVVDEGNTITVDLFSHDADLVSATLTSVYTGTNNAAIGVDGRWEIVGFSDVTDNGDGTFTLSNLVRGRRGTDHNTANHAANDKFVLLEENKLGWVPVPDEFLETSIRYRLVPLTKTLYEILPSVFTAGGLVLKPYSPVHITGDWAAASGDITIGWIRRSRSSAGWGSVDAPMAESSEAYEIDVYDGATVIRTISVSDATTATYTLAQQNTDFGSIQLSVDIIIYQISATVGRGYGRSAILTTNRPTILSFDGNDDYVDITGATTGNKFTVEFNCVPNNNTGEIDNYIIDSAAGRFVIAPKNGVTGEGWSIFDDSGWVQLQSGMNWGVSQHVAIAFDGDVPEATLYIDGSLIATKTVVSITIGGTIHLARTAAATTGYYLGTCWDLRFWNDIRTQTEIQNNKDSQLTGNESDLVAYYKLDEGVGSVATDSAGSNDGTIYGATWVFDS